MSRSAIWCSSSVVGRSMCWSLRVTSSSAPMRRFSAWSWAFCARLVLMRFSASSIRRHSSRRPRWMRVARLPCAIATMPCWIIRIGRRMFATKNNPSTRAMRLIKRRTKSTLPHCTWRSDRSSGAAVSRRTTRPPGVTHHVSEVAFRANKPLVKGHEQPRRHWHELQGPWWLGKGGADLTRARKDHGVFSEHGFEFLKKGRRERLHDHHPGEQFAVRCGQRGLPEHLIEAPKLDAAKRLIGQGGVDLRVKHVTACITLTDEALLGVDHHDLTEAQRGFAALGKVSHLVEDFQF